MMFRLILRKGVAVHYVVFSDRIRTSVSPPPILCWSQLASIMPPQREVLTACARNRSTTDAIFIYDLLLERWLLTL